MTNKEKCSELKKVRKTLADKLGINLNQRECTYEGECSGTCPKCKQEESILNSALLKKGAVILSATVLTAGLASCTLINTNEPDLSGDVEVSEPNKTVENSNDNTNITTELEGDMIEVEE